MKKITLIIAIIALSFTCKAQFDLTTEGQKMVQNALADAVVLVRQNYVLANAKGEEFGRAGQEYFGRAYGVGLFTDCGLAMPTVTAEPWRMDKAYDKYRNSDEYIPKVSITELRYAGQTKYKTATFESPEFVYTRDSAILYTSGIHKENSIHALLPEADEVSGWLVLLTASGNVETDETASIAIDAYKYTITFDKRSVQYPIEENPSMKVKTILGGAFVVPTYTSGQITFKYAGILVKGVDGWNLEKTDKIFLNCKPVANGVDTLKKLSDGQAVDSEQTDETPAKEGGKKAAKAKKSKSKSSVNAKSTTTASVSTQGNDVSTKKEENKDLNRISK